jgi:hypothetical protein
MDSTFSHIKISEEEIQENLKLELTEIEGNILDGRLITINAAGMTSGSLRNAKDGYSYFGYVKYRVTKIFKNYIGSYYYK